MKTHCPACRRESMELRMSEERVNGETIRRYWEYCWYCCNSYEIPAEKFFEEFTVGMSRANL